MTLTRPPLVRPTRGRRIAGVAAGIATHLGVSVRLLRIGLVVAALFGGVGVLLYLFWWVTVPLGNGQEQVGEPAVARLIPVQRLRNGPRLPVLELISGGFLVLLAVVLWLQHQGFQPQFDWLAAVLLILGGVGLTWSQLDAVHRRRDRRVRQDLPVLSVVGGVVLSAAGGLLLAGHLSGRGLDPGLLVQVTVASSAIVAGVGLALAPWWLRLVRALGDERAAREREAERADIAAHLHDSVLQTLALIRAQASNPDAVARMARAQERELREWLYLDRSAEGTSLAAQLRALVAEIEDSGSVPVEVELVLVGDKVPDPQTDALLAATKEALMNALGHGVPPVSVYTEIRDDAVEVFVRDHGAGFDLEAVPADRLGVRESILGRVRRRGGTATVTSSSERGTEVHLVMPARNGEHR